MKAAVIIPVTRPESLYMCMGGLLNQTFNHSEFEIILIKDSNMILELEDTDIKITQIEEDVLLPTIRRNKAVGQTDASILAFLDDDTIPPAEWLHDAVLNIEIKKIDGVCGPSLQLQSDTSLGSILAAEARKSFFLEGNDICNIYEKKQMEFYNIPFCNVVIKRKVWDLVGGLNEVVANYYMDDCEFFYLATKKGYKFYNIPEIGVQHAVEPFPLRYLKKKFITRFYTGVNTMLFHEIYSKIPFIRLGFMAYFFMIALFLLAINNWFNVVLFLILYFATAFWFSQSMFNRNKKVFVLSPVVFFLTHLTIFIAFTLGILSFFIKKRNFKPIIENKKKRFKNI